MRLIKLIMSSYSKLCVPIADLSILFISNWTQVTPASVSFYHYHCCSMHVRYTRWPVYEVHTIMNLVMMSLRAVTAIVWVLGTRLAHLRVPYNGILYDRAVEFMD